MPSAQPEVSGYSENRIFRKKSGFSEEQAEDTAQFQWRFGIRWAAGMKWKGQHPVAKMNKKIMKKEFH